METSAGGNPKVVGLTGGIAAGKSTVRAALEQLGVPCLDFDAVARGIHQDPAHPATQELARAFGGWMTAGGALQRGSLRQLFARDASANRTLLGILKPHVLEAVHGWTAAQRAPYVVWESALLVPEAIAVDRLLVVEAPVALRMARIRGRNPDWTEQHIADTLAIQAGFLPHAGINTDVLRNDNTPHSLQEQVIALHRHYLTLWS